MNSGYGRGSSRDFRLSVKNDQKLLPQYSVDECASCRRCIFWRWLCDVGWIDLGSEYKDQDSPFIKASYHSQHHLLISLTLKICSLTFTISTNPLTTATMQSFLTISISLFSLLPGVIGAPAPAEHILEARTPGNVSPSSSLPHSYPRSCRSPNRTIGLHLHRFQLEEHLRGPDCWYQ